MDQIASALEKHFSASTVRRLLSSYNPNGGTTPGDVFHTLERFCGDAEFVQPLDEIARNWNKGQGIGDEPSQDVFYYHLRYPNQFQDSVFAGHAHHAVDLLFMFQTYNHLLPAEYAEAASEMGGSFITFINGLDPWVAFAKEHDYPAMCYGPTSVSLVERQRDNITRYTAFDEFGDLQDKWTDASRDLRNETIHG